MDVRIVSYTEQGQRTARRASDALERAGHTVKTFARYPSGSDLPLQNSASDWAKDGFEASDALIFCCAAGIAVRAIAPWVRDKMTDPAVLVVDERGTFVIPILSGHIGGANALAATLAAALGAVSVITTATDLGGLFAVDVFATKNHLHISDLALCKEISAALLRKEPVGFYSEEPVEGALPEGLTTERTPLGVAVSARGIEPPFEKTLFLTPKRFCVGIGCRKGKDPGALAAFVSEELKKAGVPVEAVRCLASIDLKKEEAAIVALSKTLRVPFLTWSAEELQAVEGTFSGSAFVKAQTGADNVCERAAVKAAGGPLVVQKTARDGMTFALAKREEAISFV